MGSRYFCRHYFGHMVSVTVEADHLLAFAEAILPPGHPPLHPAEELLDIRLYASCPADLPAFPLPDPDALLGLNAGFRTDGDGFRATIAPSTRAIYRERPKRCLEMWVPDVTVDPRPVGNVAVMVALSIALADVGLHLIHAAAVAWGERAIMIAGPSRSGKTTTALLMASAGFALLSDDTVAYEADSGLIWPFGWKPRVRKEALSLFPELSRSIPEVPDGAQRARPEAVVFTRIGSEGQVSFSALSRAEAAVELMNLMVPGPLPERREASFLAVLRLVGSCALYRLTLGPNPQAIVNGLRELIGA